MSEPVAWINIEDGNSRLDWEKDEFAQTYYPLYDRPMGELTEDEIKEVYDQYFDLENFGWLHLQCILEILQKAREK
jgi:hypothetical protein